MCYHPKRLGTRSLDLRGAGRRRLQSAPAVHFRNSQRRRPATPGSRVPSFDNSMNIVCLCPTYGRRPELLENTIACFEHQDYPADKRRLFLFDDLGTLDGVVIEEPPGWSDWNPIVSQHDRCLSIADKYRAMLARIDFPFDAVAVWDDDDVYFPWHLSAHVEALRGNDWSKPSHVWTAAAQPPILESSAGRFHGLIAICCEFLERVGGWVQTKRADFDQQMMDRLAANGRCGDPCDFSPPSYVYRWQTTRAGHCSGLMSAPVNEDGYDRYQPDHPEPIAVLRPRLDRDTQELLAALVG